MALPTETDNIESVPEAARAFYNAGEDGVHRLDVEGMPDVSGLKSALAKERRQVSAFKDQLKNYEGIDPEEYNQLITMKDKFEQGGNIDEEKLNAEIEARTARMKQDHQTAYQSLEEKYNGTTAQLNKLLIDDAVARAAAKHNAIGTAVDDIASRARGTFKVVDGEVKALDNDGNVVYGSDAITPLSIEQWMADLRGTAPHLFEGSKGSGASNEGDGNKPPADGSLRRSKMTDAAKAKYINEHGRDAYLNLPN